MKYLINYSIAIVLILMALTACSDEDFHLKNDYGSTLENVGEERISKFKIQLHWLDINKKIDNLKINLIQIDGASIHELEAHTSIARDKLEVAIHIPANKRIIDGKYAFIAYQESIMIQKRLIVEFCDEMIVAASLTSADYKSKFSGEGTAESPFKLNSNNDFNNLCKLLYNDDSKAAGLYFIQMADIHLDQQGEATDDWGHANQSFAGIYDGNSYTIDNLTHIGNGTSDYDCNIGLFNTLNNGATIKNLTLKLGTCRGIKENFGGLAGQAYGTINIESITIVGSVTGIGSNVGGVIGKVNNGSNINISDVDIEIGLFELDSNIGGVIGAITNSKLTINRVRTYDNSFSFMGKKNVGGVVGYIYDTTADIRDCNFEHTTSQSNDNVLIGATESCCGGIIGNLSASTVDLKECYVYCPIGGTKTSSGYQGQHIGGLIGEQGGKFYTTITDCYVAGKVIGDKNVGGMIGYLGQTMTTFKGNNQMATAEEIGIGIYGRENIGGLFGFIDDSYIKFEGTAKLFTNVESTGRNAGGVAGNMRLSDLNTSNVEFTTAGTMTVKGVDYVGGLIGYMTDQSELLSDNTKNPESGNIPSSTEHTLDFHGNVQGANYVGGAVGCLENSSLSNICVKANVIGNGTHVGGVAGAMLFASSGSERASSVKFIGEVKNDNGERTGGIAGSIDGQGGISFSINYGTVSGSKFSGGIVGHTDYTDQAPEIKYNTNVGDVTGSLAAGGVCGHATSNDGIWLEITCCSNFGNISCAGGSGDVNNWWGLGGILGSCDHKKIKITNCSNHGEIKGTSNSFHGVGGIAGVMGNDPGGARESDNLYLYSCANYGNISSTGGWVGGILGFQEEGEEGKNDGNSVVEDCINHGQITDGGGIIGFVDHYSQQRRCINFGKINGGDALVDKEKDGAVTHQHNLYYLVTSGTDSWGESFTSEEQNKQSTFSNFDFTNVWRLDADDPYPILRNCFGQDAQKPE